MRRVTLVLQDDLFDKLEKASEDRGVSKNLLLTKALEFALDHMPPVENLFAVVPKIQYPPQVRALKGDIA